MKKFFIALTLFSSIGSLNAAEGHPAKKIKIEPLDDLAGGGEAEPAAVAGYPVTSFTLKFNTGKTLNVAANFKKWFSRLSPWDESDQEYYQNLPHEVDFSHQTFLRLFIYCKYGSSLSGVSLKNLDDITLNNLVYAADELELTNDNGELVTLFAHVYMRNKDKSLMQDIEESYQDNIIEVAKKTARELKRLSY